MQQRQDSGPSSWLGSHRLKLMRWALVSWERVDFLNKYLGGTLLPRLQLDLIPGFFCGAHFLISSARKLTDDADYQAGGRATQRFWLTATQQGLQFQPEMTPLIFSRFVLEQRQFTIASGASRLAGDLAKALTGILGRDFAERGVFMGRVGFGKPPTSRSTRLDMRDLVKTEAR